MPAASSGRLLLAWAPAVIWGALIFALSAQPDLRFADDEGVDFVVRKLGHMGVFGILALLLLRAVRTTSWPRPWVLALALTALYAVTDEVHQSAVIGRNASAVDVGVDVVGAVIALLVIGLIDRGRN